MILLLLMLQPLVEMKVTVDKEEITVGELLKYEIEMNVGEGVHVELPEIKKMGNFEVRDSKVERVGSTIKLTYILATFNVGEDTIPSLSVKCTDKEGKKFKLTTDAKPIRVKSVLPPSLTDIKDIKSPLLLPYSPVLLYIGIGVLAIIGYIVWRLLRRKRAPIEKKILEELPPHIIAYERLNKLRLEDGKVKEYYIELSDIIRRYIEGRYEISAPTYTTVELFRELTRKRMELRNFVRDFLSDCDLVKFAKVIPPSELIKKDKERAFEIIDKTKPKEESK